MHPGRNTKRVSHCRLTVAKKCHDSENGCKRFGGHRMWASDAAVGFVHGAKAKDKNDKGRYTLYGLKFEMLRQFPSGLITPSRMP